MNSLLNTKLYLLDARFPDPEHHALYNRLYAFWHEIWHSTFRELQGKGIDDSDDFLRQDEICALVNAGDIMGSVSMHWFNLNLKSHMAHSYFNTYPEKVLAELGRLNLNTVMAMGQLAVAPQWRKGAVGPLVSEILFGAACRRFLESGAGAVITYTRNNRGTNNLCYRHGARCLAAKQKAHNVEVDFVTILREEARDTDLPEIPLQLERLWRARIFSRTAGRYLENDFQIKKQAA